MSDLEQKTTDCSGNCSCCGSDCESFNPEQPVITLTMDDDTTVNCAVLTIFPANGREYIALLPLDEEGENEDGEVYLYRYEENENGQPTLDNIEDDEEYEIVADAFDQMLDTAEFEEFETPELD